MRDVSQNEYDRIIAWAWRHSRRVFPGLVDSEDFVVGSAHLAITDAARKDKPHTADFVTFACECVRRQLIKSAERLGRERKRKPRIVTMNPAEINRRIDERYSYE